jgi:hypothetical protein
LARAKAARRSGVPMATAAKLPANWSSGTPPSTNGWKGAARSCISST